MACGGPVSGDELWRDCVSWLTRCEVLRNDHKANWPNATIKDLAYILRDGVLLCNLLKTLDPGCIDDKDVSQKPQMAQFLCLRNIQIFLQTCKDIFGIRETDLFEPLMLFELSNFHQVLYTLSKLSNSAKAQRRNIPGFSVHKNGSKEDIYQSLRSMDVPVARYCAEEEHTEYATYYSHIKNEEIYQDLMAVRQNISVPPVEKRDHVIKELLDTEKNYVEVLKTLNVSFMKPLSFLLAPNTLQEIFKDIPELYSIHTDFLRQLQEFQLDERHRLSNTFLNFREKFLIYGSYCANLTEAQSVLQGECDQNEIINQEVNRCQQDANNGKFKLRDVLSVPMQRILKYHLLLEKLIEETPRSHEDYNGLKRAREAMLDVATYINEVKRDSDHLSLLKQVKENISDWTLPLESSLHIYGHLLKDGELKIKSHDDQKIRIRYVFIFDKIMVLCKPVRSNQFSFKEYLQLQDFVQEDSISRAVMNRDARWSYQWLLVRKNKQTVYTLYARTSDLKKKMMNAIEEALDNLEPCSLKNTTHRLDLQTFESPVSCNRCSKFLKGLIYQGYKCVVCGIAVHKECISGAGKCSPFSSGLCAHRDLPPLNYIDEQLREHLWFAESMDREDATRELEGKKLGTYLLRIRPQGGEARYALSLKTEDNVRHMRVFNKKVDDIEQFYLSEARFFKTIVELVNFYEKTSLKENYERLSESAKLLWSYKKYNAEAISDWTPMDGDSSHIPLRVGCKVIILDKPESENWWKGCVQKRVGYFPKNCIRIIGELYE